MRGKVVSVKMSMKSSEAEQFEVEVEQCAEEREVVSMVSQSSNF